MVGCDAVLLYGVEVLRCGVAFVAVPAVGGVFVVEAQHELVAVCLGEDAGGGDGHVGGVAFDKGLVRDVGLVVEAVAVDEQELGVYGAEGCAAADDIGGHVAEECLGGEAHGVGGGMQYVEAVDVGGVDGGHSPCEGVGFYVGAQDVALPFGQLLGVVEDGVGVA